jgi:hypothetical protein
MTLRVGPAFVPSSHTLKLWLSAIVAAGIAWGVKLGLIETRRPLMALAVVTTFAVAYLLLTAVMNVDEALHITSRITSRFTRRRGA